ncbi:MAG: hypothetical protein NVS3B3_21790 [Aquirhabdus sp.]
MALIKISYNDLNSRQKENYNFQKISATLADYGFATIRLTDDWQGADFIAQHIDGDTFLKVQLKGRLTIDKKYMEKNLFICFRHADKRWYMYPHDVMVTYLLEATNIGNTQSWIQDGLYSMKTIGKTTLQYLEQFAL